MKKLLTIGAVAMFATPAFAANNIFSCTAENGSPVSVTKNGSDYEFTYGQVSFKNPVKQVFANQDSYVATTLRRSIPRSSTSTMALTLSSCRTASTPVASAGTSIWLRRASSSSPLTAEVQPTVG